LRDPSEAVQELAIKGLKKIGDPSVIEPIVGVLLRGTPGAQYHAAQALRALGWSPRTPGEQIPYYVAIGDFKHVAGFGGAAIAALAGALRSESVERRVAVAEVLGEMDDPAAMKPLVAALKDAEPMVRTAAINGLAQLRFPQVATTLMPMLRDRAGNVRVAAVTALGQLGDSHTVELLLEMADDRDWEVRTALAEALGRLGDRRALKVVLTLLRDPDQEVRQSAADALGRVGDESVVEGLLMAMVDEHMGVRQAAARSLVMVEPYWERSERVLAFVPRLQEAMRNREPSVQKAAAGLLQRLTGRNAVELLALDTRKYARDGDQITGMFERLLRDPDEYVRLAAAEALGRSQHPDGVPLLQAALSDPNKWVKQAAERSLETITNGG